MTKAEIVEVAALMPRYSSHMFMAGILMSSKTLCGIPNKYPKRENVRDILYAAPMVMNIIHYNTDDPDSLLLQLAALEGMYGAWAETVPCVDGFQLNVAWPDPKMIEQANRLLRGYFKKIILQVGGRALEMVGRDPNALAERIKDYVGEVGYVLIDPSGGVGKLMDVPFATDCVRAIRDRGLTVGVGVAGGLSLETLDLIRPLIDEFPDLSIDAEGRLRDEDDCLILNRAKEYVCKAIEICKVKPFP